MEIGLGIILVFVIIGVILVKYQPQNKSTRILFLIIAGFLFYFSIFFILNVNVIDLTDFSGIMSSIKISLVWLGQTTSNLWEVGKDAGQAVGNVIKRVI